MFISSTIRHVRPVLATFVRNGSHGGVPGENLPFKIHGKYRLTLLFTLYVSTGLSAPYLILRHQMLKK